MKKEFFHTFVYYYFLVDMLQDLFLVSSSFLLCSSIFCCIMLWVFSAKSKPKKIFALAYTILTFFLISYSLETYQNPQMPTEKFDFGYSIICIILAILLYAYCMVLMQAKKIDRYFILKMSVPVVLYVVLYLLFGLLQANILHLYTTEDLWKNIQNPMLWLRIIPFVHFVILSLYFSVQIVKMYKRHKQRIATLFSYEEKINLSWLPYLLGLIIIYGIATIFDMMLSGYSLELLIVSNFSYSLIYLACALLAVNQQDIFFDVLEQEEIKLLQTEKNSTIPSNIHLQLNKKLKILMEEQKIYLNPELRLDFVVKELNTNRTYLSTVIKEDYKENFMGFVNRYRINEAKQLLNNTENNANLSEIAEIVGFKSISSFNTFFKRYTGKSPMEYRRFR